MRALILKMELSVDGFVGHDGEKPSWPLDYYDDELTAYELELLGNAGVHAMGRVSYAGMASYWQASDEPFAKPMNEIPKAVFSRTMRKATWPESTIHRDIENGVRELKAQDGKPILAHGGASLARQLTRLGLVDEFRLTVHPVAFGDGRRLFGAHVELELLDVRRFATGSVAYTYVRR
jgi:dihydrofolate reductase